MPTLTPNPMPPAAAAHATHDPLAIAAYAAGDATGGELTAASALVATCEACAALHHDLRAIALALPATTAPAPRPRDFRLTPDQAASLTPTGWRRLLAPFAGPSFGFAKPLGTGLATLGLTGILVAGASGIPLGGATAMPADQASGGGAVAMQAPAASGVEQEKVGLPPVDADASQAPAEVPAAAASEDPGVAMPMSVPEPTGEPAFATGVAGAAGGANGTTEGTTEGATGEDGQPVARAADPYEEAADPASTSPVPVVGLVSLVALLAGLVLLGLRYAGRRAQRIA